MGLQRLMSLTSKQSVAFTASFTRNKDLLFIQNSPSYSLLRAIAAMITNGVAKTNSAGVKSNSTIT
jgi:hypothetical protein